MGTKRLLEKGEKILSTDEMLDCGNGQGDIFKNQTQFLDYIDEKYKLKVKK